MKAVVYTRYGSPDVLEFKDIEKPVPKDDQVLIKIRAASINSWDWDMLTGKPLEYRTFSGLLRPTKTNILGCDIAGEVEAVGQNISQFRPGDLVLGDLSEKSWGGFAEYVCARETELIHKPAAMTFEDAAALPQAGLLALQGLGRFRNIQPQEEVLINGAGGGVGTFAVQIAKSLGARVTGVDSAVKLETISTLGADHVIDYAKKDFTRNKKSYDLILDVRTDRSVFSYRRVLKEGGTYVTVGGRTPQIIQLVTLGSLLSKIGSRKLALLMHKPNKDLNALCGLYEKGKIKPVISKTYPLSRTVEAFRYFEKGEFKGKIIVTTKDN